MSDQPESEGASTDDAPQKPAPPPLSSGSAGPPPVARRWGWLLLVAALASLGNTAAGDLVGVGRDWRRSGKVVRIEAGSPLTIYFRRDVTLE